MLGLLTLHVAALLLWVALLLYLPALINGVHSGLVNLDSGARRNSMARFIFTRVATPAALVAIVAGTMVFVLNRTLAFWLIAKLTLVSLLVICHGLMGLLILRAESGALRHPRRWYGTLAGVVSLLLLAILWLVLAKPQWQGWFAWEEAQWLG